MGTDQSENLWGNTWFKQDIFTGIVYIHNLVFSLYQYLHFCSCVPDVGVDIQLLFCKFLFLAFSFLWTLWLIEYHFLLLQHCDCRMRLLTIYHHFAINSNMTCRSGSRTSWTAIRALQCYLRHLAHAWGGTTWHQTCVDKPARSWKLLFFRPLGSLGCFRIVSSRASLRIPGALFHMSWMFFSLSDSDLVRILYHQTERFSWWTPILRREAIQGFFKGKLLDPTAEFDGKQLPWTLVDYVAQTSKDGSTFHFCARNMKVG